MSFLKDDKSSIIKAKSKLASVISELGEVETNDAIELIDWFLEKSKYCRKHKKREKFPYLPHQMQRGDIIWVNFGINVGDEFSDYKADGHFAIYWCQNGYQIIVIPVSSEERKPEKNDFAVNIGKVPGLPKEKDSYAKLDTIRAVSIRRIRRIKGQPEGKISLEKTNPEGLKKITNKIKEKFE